MIQAQYLAEDEFLFFCTLIEEKREPTKTRLRDIRTRISACYSQYLQQFQNLPTKPVSEFAGEGPLKEALNSCYDSATASFKDVRGRIINNQPNSLKALCPYCLLDRPSTLDHYVGKTEFPEYSVLIKNLVPCCGNCNNKKGESWRHLGGRKFIHFYIDNFFHRKFLQADLVFSNGSNIPAIQFFLVRPHNMSINEFRIAQNHFAALKLLNEYAISAIPKISSEFQVIQKALSVGTTPEKLKVNLLDRAQADRSMLGPNCWSAVMYEAMANSPQFLTRR